MRKSVDLTLATRLINHGPIVLVSSSLGKKTGITPVAWHMPIQKKPPIIALVIDEGHFIFECVMDTGDFAVNIPSNRLVKEIIDCGAVSARDTDKLELSGLSVSPSKTVSSPCINEAIGVLECGLIKDTHLLEQYNIVLGEVRYAEAEEGLFDQHWTLAPGQKTLHHLGGNIFCDSGIRVRDIAAGREKT
jgi:flavin reductase (DIM6/NTAB) family NADH-FMN oxidoreductase RutF